MRLLRSFGLAVLLCLLGAAPAALQAHSLLITQVLMTFDQPGTVKVKIDIDFTLMLGSTQDYAKLATGDAAYRKQAMARLVPKLLDDMQFFTGEDRLALVLQDYTLPTVSPTEFADATVDKFTTLNFLAILPASHGPLKIVVPIGGRVDFPVAYTIQIPSAHVSVTRWMEAGTHESDPYAWADKTPRPGEVVATAPAPDSSAAAGKAGPVAPAAAAATMQDEVDAMPWYHQLTMYLRLGFRHIVPQGMDHILFVLGLFFLGITWRKLLSQTTVFTVAHATTLFLSTYGIFRAPSWLVEPLIALSIAFIAFENVWHPKLGVWRLAVVFGFGLIHGLGFATSLSQIPFPKHQFVVALLGFNFGVDFGQLFIIGVAFLAVGGFRNKPWFRARIAIPCSIVIGSIGLFWAIQRIIFYSTH